MPHVLRMLWIQSSRRILGSVGRLAARLRHSKTPALVTFAYHGVTRNESTAGASGGLHLPCADFERHCRTIAAYFRPIQFDDLLNLERPEGPGPFALVTFDDIYDNVAQIALPVLEQYRLPFAVFLTTAYVGGRARFWWDDLRLSLLTVPYLNFSIGNRGVQLATLEERENAIAAAEAYLAGLDCPSREEIICDLLTRSEKYVRSVFGKILDEWLPVREESLRFLEKHPLCRVGLHSHSHPALTDITPAALQDELSRSQEWHCQRYGLPCSDICFPFGACNPRVVEASTAAGFRVGFLLNPHRQPGLSGDGLGRGMTLVNRFSPSPWDSEGAIRRISGGGLDFFIRCFGAERI